MPQRPRFRPTACKSHTRGVRVVGITVQPRSWRSEDTLPSPAHHFRFERAASGAIYRPALARRAVNSRVFCRVPWMPNGGLLQRPSDWAISGSIGFGVRELLLVRVQEARNVALGGVPAEFLVERGD